MNNNKKRILVVDDDQSITRLLKVCLEGTDRFVVETENVATHAVEAARQFEPDLILLDVMMPELDGAVLVNYFKENPKLRNVPVVFLTALATPDEVHQHGGLIGGLPFIPKPVSIPEVLDCLDKQLAA